ncbi:flavin reductase family protein [Paenalcaligenes hominis]|uniref:flavin reductase family protein n=1 Tax=Paenalcaligenes hominis TaxID=643674 RepID=UPI003523A8BF
MMTPSCKQTHTLEGMIKLSSEGQRGQSGRLVSNDDFRAAMSRVVAPVAVVTTVVNHVPYGTTVSAFMSLSLNPPMIVVSLEATSCLLSMLEIGSAIGLNVLAEGQAEEARRFATKSKDKFADVPWQHDAGAARLQQTHLWVAGYVTEMRPAGDHVLVLMNVQSTALAENSPMTYWQSSFGTHAVLTSAGH